MLISVPYPKLKLDELGDKIVFVFPHPDDETMATGGLMAKLAAAGRDVHSITATRGEQGFAYCGLHPKQLGPIRALELARALEILGVSSHEVWEYPDGGVAEQHKEVEQRLVARLDELKPDLVVTYEKAGMYGHPDHIAMARMVHNYVGVGKAAKAGEAGEAANTAKAGNTAKAANTAKALYVTYPKSIAKVIGLPTHMASPEVVLFDSPPQFRLSLGIKYLRKKYLAAKAHESQGLRRGLKKLYWPVFAGYEYYTWDF